MPGQKNTGMFIESGGSNAMALITDSVISPVTPMTTLNVNRRDSHQRKIAAVLRSSAGAGKSRRVRADTAALRRFDPSKFKGGHAVYQVLCITELDDARPELLDGSAVPFRGRRVVTRRRREPIRRGVSRSLRRSRPIPRHTHSPSSVEHGELHHAPPDAPLVRRRGDASRP